MLHLAAVAAWHMYVYAHIARKDLTSKLPMPLQCWQHEQPTLKNFDESKSEDNGGAGEPATLPSDDENAQRSIVEPHLVERPPEPPLP